MTWDTQLGMRILEGVEAKFYLSAMQFTAAYLQETEEWGDELDIETGDRIFDSASFDQKIVLLHYCLSALLNPEVFPPKLTNLMEAAAFLPFAFLEMKVEEELEDEQAWTEDGTIEEEEDDLIYFYRKFVWDAYEVLILAELEPPDSDFEEENEEPFPTYRTADRVDWINIIDELTSRIFYDRDWQITSLHPQLLDGLGKSFSAQTGINEDYITNRLPQVTPEQAEAALTSIKNWKLP